MSTLARLDETNAPAASVPLIEKSKKAFGRLPGLHSVLSASPAAFEGYQVLHRLFAEQTAFDADEKTVVWQTINVEHQCHYCVPAHTGIAKMMGVSDDISNALRDETPLPTTRLESLRSFTLAMVRDRGSVSDDALQTFYDAGYEQRHVLEVVLGLAQKVMSNYINHIADTPVDQVMQKFAWTPKSGR
ncbi:carboxymuconolactone decarboxylase family protein [Puniceibacterium sediminis]|uniref:Alkylhydroperoxidase AhpD family core domain-containing protein n=1 Tax=Puniceibacterium sediminis TaxID=1608407 RepID=A0A238WD28_9RHOB|nr:carboxymuconolactone decarboxylase family protein [Puniceibacterium sediminis]SNR44327.1 alkylhydroperoxidase AhpD family core domain-containing protein [Puniceibacterium sediminis]